MMGVKKINVGAAAVAKERNVVATGAIVRDHNGKVLEILVKTHAGLNSD